VAVRRLAGFYFFAFTIRAFARFWRYGDRDWLWLREICGAP